MKTFIVPFDGSEFTKTQVNDTTASWISPIWDLYDNNVYTNWATRRANYGTDLLENGIYTGLNRIDDQTTEIGYIETDPLYDPNTRFVDTAGNIDIMTWVLQEVEAPFEADVNFSLNVYTSDHLDGLSVGGVPTEPYSDWAVKTARQGQDLLIINSPRYAFFELVLETEPGINTDAIEFLMGIILEVDSSVVNGYFSKTLALLNNFPEWMTMREIENTSAATPIDATPSSLGGKFLNAVAGEPLTDLASKLQYEQYQHYIDTVDTSQLAWAYKVDNAPPYVLSVRYSETKKLMQCASLAEFYACTEDDEVYYWDIQTRRIFFTKHWDFILVLGLNDVETYDSPEIIPYHVWNHIDDIGAAVDLFRLTEELESNDSFRKRIKDVYANRPGTGIEAFKKALRRELNLWLHMDGATPDSDYIGATPTVLEIEDLERESKYFDPDGMPTDVFLSLIDQLARDYPVLWGYFDYNQAFWDPDGLERKGIKTIDRRFDATPMAEQYLDSGVGDVNDLYLFKPAEYSVPQEFTANLKIKGREKDIQSQYAGLAFDVSVYGQADIEMFDPEELTGNFTIELTTSDATPVVYYSNITVTSTNQDATPSASVNSWSLVDWVTANGFTNNFYQFFNKATNELYVNGDATPSSGQIDLSTINIVTVKPGHYDWDTSSYVDAPTFSKYKLWFEDDSGVVLGQGGSSISIEKDPYDYLTATGDLIFQSQVVNYLGYVADSWVSDNFLFNIKVDGALPDFTQQDFTLDIPNINWPTGSLNREIVMRLETLSSEEYGAFTDPNAATPMFFNDTYINVDGDNTWTDGRYKFLSSSTTSVIFSSNPGIGYPIDMPIWTLFEASYNDVISGTVDSNGPWRDGEPQLYGANNEILEFLNLTRSDFGLPETTDYIITWIGIESVDNNNVICWLDSNTIQPAVTFDGETDFNISYPDNVVVESYDEDTLAYIFSSFPFKAKLKLNVNREWYPKLHSGWFYDDVDNFYVYAQRNTETTTQATYTLLNGPNRQGAPIIVTDDTGSNTLRQIHFWTLDQFGEPQLTTTNTEIVNGNNTSNLYASYENIYNITVTDLTTNESITLGSTSSSTNEIELPSVSNFDHRYQLTYKVVQSFIFNNDHLDGATPAAQIMFDATPSTYGYSHYIINYETSLYDPATPIPVPLNTLHTDFSEGFLYIDHDVYDLHRIEIKVSPSQVLAINEDYLLVTLEAYDRFGNPKPNIEINLYTNFGTLEPTVVTTDRDGRAYAILDSQIWNDATPFDPSPATPALPDPIANSYPQGLILAESGSNNAITAFDIHRVKLPQNQIIAVMESDHILCNSSATHIFGRLLDNNKQPIASATIYWRKARTVYELFNSIDYSQDSATPGQVGIAGQVITDSAGRFTIGPFNSNEEPGYWLVSVENLTEGSWPFEQSDPNLIGDIVYWYEYPDVTISIDPVTGQPPYPIQRATPSWQIPNYTFGSVFPVTLDEEDFLAGESATPSIQWNPPIWYAIDKYKQYHMGLSAMQGYFNEDNYGDGFDFATPSYPDYKEL